MLSASSQFCCDWSSARGGYRVAEFLHKLTHDDGQLTCNFIPELRVAFFRRNLLREVNNHPAT